MTDHKCEWGPKDKHGYQGCECGAVRRVNQPPDANGVVWDEYYDATYMKLFRAPMTSEDQHKPPTT